MKIVGLLNVGSLLLGIVALAIPIIRIMEYSRRNSKKRDIYCFLSLAACAISLIFQIFYQYHLVKIADWSALMDTTGAVVFAAVVLLIGTLILNAISIVVFRIRFANKMKTNML